jgi:hypothetical protein
MKVVGNQFGIEITKPWSKEMYKHNNIAREEVKSEVRNFLTEEVDSFLTKEGLHDSDLASCSFATKDLKERGYEKLANSVRTILKFSTGNGFYFDEVLEQVENRLENLAYFEARDIAERLDIKHKIVGFK